MAGAAVKFYEAGRFHYLISRYFGFPVDSSVLTATMGGMAKTKFTAPVINIKKYGGRQVAIVNGRIVADGIDTREVLARAKRKFPRATWRDILPMGVPKGLAMGYQCA